MGYRWCFHQFRNELYTVFPSKSKLISIGFGADATHTIKTNRFNTNLNNGEQLVFSFDKNPILDKALIKEFRNKFSIYNRLVEKLLK